MKPFRILVLAAVGFAGAAFSLQDAQVLQRTLTENSLETYKVDTSLKQTIDSAVLGEMPMNVTTAMTYAIKTGKVDSTAGTADVQVTITVDKIDADGPLGQMVGQTQIKPIVETGTIDKRGQLTLTAPKGSDALQMALAGTESTQASMFIELPDHPVKVGDTWNITIPKSPFTGPDDQIITAKLAGDKTLDGRPVWIVDVSGDLKTAFDSSKVTTSNESTNPLASIKILSKGTVEVTGEAMVDKATGKTVSYTTGGKMRESFDVPDKQMTMESNGTYTSTVKLQI